MEMELVLHEKNRKLNDIFPKVITNLILQYEYLPYPIHPFCKWFEIFPKIGETWKHSEYWYSFEIIRIYPKYIVGRRYYQVSTNVREYGDIYLVEHDMGVWIKIKTRQDD